MLLCDSHSPPPLRGNSLPSALRTSESRISVMIKEVGGHLPCHISSTMPEQAATNASYLPHIAIVRIAEGTVWLRGHVKHAIQVSCRVYTI